MMTQIKKVLPEQLPYGSKRRGVSLVGIFVFCVSLLISVNALFSGLIDFFNNIFFKFAFRILYFFDLYPVFIFLYLSDCSAYLLRSSYKKSVPVLGDCCE